MAEETAAAIAEVSAEKAAPAKKNAAKIVWKAAQFLLIALVIETTASLMPAVVELIYSQLIYYYIVRGLSFLNKFVNFSLGEIVLLALAI
ncbi:MAG: hypothetical protein J2P41_19350, partial [Blastocatellia bacterium]|nr:hypothetical protein [Blastocatellia bacterium]